MKPVLGKTMKNKRVVSNNGLEIGNIFDVCFENDGKIISLIVTPEKQTKEIKDYLNKSGLLEIPYESVRAIGRYVIVEFPFSK